MRINGAVVAGALVLLVTLAGCGQGSRTTSALKDGSSSSELSAMPDHFVADTGVEDTPVIPILGDFSFDVNDPSELRDYSVAVVSGWVTGVERSYVDGNGFIVTVYSVQVQTVYKGEKIADTISVGLLGGTVPLGEYIASLDATGLYEMKLGSKDLDRDGEPDGGDGGHQDPRTMDPNQPVTENWGANPASAKLLAELQPELWVFYLGGTEHDAYYGTVAEESLKYLKDGMVHSLNAPGAVDTVTKAEPYPEAELGGK